MVLESSGGAVTASSVVVVVPSVVVVVVDVFGFPVVLLLFVLAFGFFVVLGFNVVVLVLFSVICASDLEFLALTSLSVVVRSLEESVVRSVLVVAVAEAVVSDDVVVASLSSLGIWNRDLYRTTRRKGTVAKCTWCSHIEKDKVESFIKTKVACYLYGYVYKQMQI